MTSFRYVISLGHIKICRNLWLSSLVMWRGGGVRGAGITMESVKKIVVLCMRKAFAIRKLITVQCGCCWYRLLRKSI